MLNVRQNWIVKHPLRALWLLSGVLLAQHVNAYPVQTFGLADGLPSATVYSMAEDDTGRLIVHTRAGLAAYDGKTFERIRNIGGVDTSRTRVLFGDSAGRVWVMMQGPPSWTGFYADGRWQPIEEPPRMPTQVDATIYGASNAPATERLFSTNDGALVHHAAGRWQVHPAYLPASRDLTGIEPWQGGFLLVTSKGLCRFAADGGPDCSVLKVDDGYVRAARALTDSGDAVWILSDRWLRLYTGLSHEAEMVLQRAIPDVSAEDERDRASLIIDAWGDLIIGSAAATVLVNPGDGDKCCEDLNDLIPSAVRTVYQDRERQLWFGSLDGLHRISTRAFRVFDQRSGLFENEVTAIAMRADGHLVFGHNAGLTVFDGQHVEATFPLPLPDDAAMFNARVLDLAAVGEDVWFAASNAGFGVQRPDGSLDTVGGTGNAVSVAPAGDEGVYLMDLLALRYHAGDGSMTTLLESDADDHFRKLVQLDGQTHVIARGAIYFAEGTHRWRKVDGPAGVALYALANFEGQTYVGTEKGLYRIEGERWVRQGPFGDPGPELPVYGLLSTPGALVAGTIDGFFELTDQGILRRSYEDGLPGRETNRDALLDAGNGNFWVGTESGLALYRPRYDRPLATPPRLHLVGMDVAGRAVPLDQDLSVSSDENRLEYRFDVTSLRGVEGTVVRTRLVGLEDTWALPQPSSAGRIRYLNAPPGEYRFEIQASRDGQRWEDAIVAPSVRIRTPFTATTTFRLSMLLLLASLFGGLLAFQRRRIRIANLDALTGLPNRRAFLSALRKAVRRGEGHGAIVFMDLNDFKIINDSFGHETGDRVLATLGKRLEKTVSGDGIIARFGGDEFTLLLRGSSARAFMQRGGLLDRLSATCSTPIDDNEARVQLSASFGIRAFKGGESQSVETLIRDADTAMYRAKGMGRGEAVVYSDSMRDEAKRRLDLENAIRRGIANLEFDCEFQPIVDIADGRLVGLEALARWRTGGETLGPDAFLEAARRSGLVREIGLRVLDRTLRALRHWEFVSGDDFYVSVNASAVELRDARFARDVEAALERYEINPGRLVIEITEESLLDRDESVLTQLWTLKQRGVRFLVDDFGTGYSSFGYLDDLPVSGIKIDRSFLVDVEHIERKQKIVAAMVGLAESLNFQVIAEGVETRAQLELLKRVRCPLGQGYYFGRPTTRKGVLERLQG